MQIPWGPTGQVVYERTYSRTKPDGTKETWPETVQRVAYGNIALVHGSHPGLWSKEAAEEAWRLKYYMERFAILPAGRHLWASGVKDRSYLFNCHVAGWGDRLSDHYEFSALRLFEGGGVGANYSMKHIEKYGAPTQPVAVHVIAEPQHADIEEVRPLLSKEYTSGATGSALWEVHEVDDSREGWAAALTELIDSAYWGSAFVPARELIYDVSDIRPSGSPLVSSGGTASGPAPLAKLLLDVAEILNRAHEAGVLTPLDAMSIDHAVSEAVIAGGNRRSARMSIVHWDDPYIHEFITAKLNTGKHWTTNISVEVDSEFFDQLKDEGSKARRVHEDVTFAMLENGEPGYWNSTRSQVGEVGSVIATNPCGEIALESWENCNLGHVNLDAFAPQPDGEGGRTTFDYDGMKEAHRLITRFLIRATYGDVNDAKQAEVLARNRRIGVGHLGVQGFWAKLGVKYSKIPDSGASSMLITLYEIVRKTAREYAFQLRIPEPVKVTAVAPTGSIAKLPGVSEGIHPIYSRWFERRVRFSKRDPDQRAQLIAFEEQGFKLENDIYDQSGKTMVVVFPTEDILLSQVRALGWWQPEDLVESADEIHPEDMLRVQRVYQEHWADNAVSYTINLLKGAITPAGLEKMLARHLPHLKGTTVMVDESRPQAPYTRITREQYAVAAAKTIEDSTDADCASGACPIR